MQGQEPAPLLGAAAGNAVGQQHHQDQQGIPGHEAVADGHAENALRQGQQAVAQLGHKGEAQPRDQNGDDRSAPPFSLGGQFIPAGQRLGSGPQRLQAQQQLHQRKHGAQSQQHGGKGQPFLCHRHLLPRRNVQAQADGVMEPVHGGGQALGIVGGQPVVGIQQLHPAGGAVLKAAEGGIPGSVIRVGAQELGAQIAFQQHVVHIVLIIPEIAEFIIFCLQQQHIVEMNVLAVVGAGVEQLAALQHHRPGGDIRPGVGRCHAPAAPGAHGMPADRQSAAVHIGKLRQQPVGVHAAAGAVRDRVALAVPAVQGIKEGEVGEIHHHPVADGPADVL